MNDFSLKKYIGTKKKKFILSKVSWLGVKIRNQGSFWSIWYGAGWINRLQWIKSDA